MRGNNQVIKVRTERVSGIKPRLQQLLTLINSIVSSTIITITIHVTASPICWTLTVCPPKFVC